MAGLPQEVTKDKEVPKWKASSDDVLYLKIPPSLEGRLADADCQKAQRMFPYPGKLLLAFLMLTPCSFKKKRQQTEKHKVHCVGKAPPSSPLHRKSVSQVWAKKESLAQLQHKSILLQTKPLTYRTEHLGLGV